MIDALHIAASGLKGQQSQIDTISNNVANMQTPGFKQQRGSFADVSVITPGQVQAGMAPEHAGAGTQLVDTRTLFSQGTLRLTGNTWDLAIQGDGFLEVVDDAGNHLYTRDGQLHVDSQGRLATAGGYRLAQDIQIPPDAKNLTVDANGQISAIVGNDTATTVIGIIDLSSFPSPEGLQAVGSGNYAPTEASGEPTLGKANENGAGSIVQGSLEGANVDMVDAMSSLMMAQRAYQLNARVLQAADQILDTINNLRQ
jgi:flagellar basal-body rod protein FlgG